MLTNISKRLIERERNDKDIAVKSYTIAIKDYEAEIAKKLVRWINMYNYLYEFIKDFPEEADDNLMGQLDMARHIKQMLDEEEDTDE